MTLRQAQQRTGSQRNLPPLPPKSNVPEQQFKLRIDQVKSELLFLLQINANSQNKIESLRSNCQEYKIRSKRQILKTLDELYRSHQNLIDSCNNELLALQITIENALQLCDTKEESIQQKYYRLVDLADALSNRMDDNHAHMNLESLNLPTNLELRIKPQIENALHSLSSESQGFSITQSLRTLFKELSLPFPQDLPIQNLLLRLRDYIVPYKQQLQSEYVRIYQENKELKYEPKYDIDQNRCLETMKQNRGESSLNSQKYIEATFRNQKNQNINEGAEFADKLRLLALRLTTRDIKNQAISSQAERMGIMIDRQIKSKKQEFSIRVRSIIDRYT